MRQVICGPVDPARIPGSGQWICRKTALNGQCAIYSRHWWRWSAQHAAYMYETFNLSPFCPRATVFHASEMGSHGDANG